MPYITPDVLPSTTYCRRLLIPNDPKWIGTVTGALLPLTFASSWSQIEGITAEEAADRVKIMMKDYYASGGEGECEDMACCEEKATLHRFDTDTGRPQISTDGGVTWKDDPADTQNLIPLYPPIVGEGKPNTKCDAATNASQHVNDLIDATALNLTTAGDVFELAVGIAGAALALFLIITSAGTLTAPVTAVATALWAAAQAAFSMGVTAFENYWDTDKRDAILCALYCNIGENGQFDEAQYQNFRSDIKAQLPASPAFDIVMTSINAGGARGLSQMASYGNAAEADCTSCTSCLSCIERWEIFDGAGANAVRTEEYIEIDSVVWGGTGGWAIALTTNSPTACCYVRKVTTTAGVEFTPLSAYRACGEPIPVPGEAFGHNTVYCQLANTFVIYGNAVEGRMRIYLSDEPCPP